MTWSVPPPVTALSTAARNTALSSNSPSLMALSMRVYS